VFATGVYPYAYMTGLDKFQETCLIATISHRQAVANNPLVDGYNPSKPNSWIQYLDANNLHGCSMSEPLPVGKFRFLDEQEIESFDVMSIPADADTGYIVEFDLTYPQTLHHLHNDYPMTPEHLAVDTDVQRVCP